MITITQTIENNKTFYTFENRKTDYTLTYNDTWNEWELWSERQALSHSVPSIRHFKTLKELEQNIKSLTGIAALIGSPTVQ